MSSVLDMLLDSAAVRVEVARGACLSYGSFDGVKFGQNSALNVSVRGSSSSGCLAAFYRTIEQAAYLLVLRKSLYLLGSSLGPPNRSLRQRDTDIKDRLLRNQCLKCDYDQMCMQIVSASGGFSQYHTDACYHNSAARAAIGGNQSALHFRLPSGARFRVVF